MVNWHAILAGQDSTVVGSDNSTMSTGGAATAAFRHSKTSASALLVRAVDGINAGRIKARSADASPDQKLVQLGAGSVDDNPDQKAAKLDAGSVDDNPDQKAAKLGAGSVDDNPDQKAAKFGAGSVDVILEIQPKLYK